MFHIVDKRRHRSVVLFGQFLCIHSPSTRLLALLEAFFNGSLPLMPGATAPACSASTMLRPSWVVLLILPSTIRTICSMRFSVGTCLSLKYNLVGRSLRRPAAMDAGGVRLAKWTSTSRQIWNRFLGFPLSRTLQLARC